MEKLKQRAKSSQLPLSRLVLGQEFSFCSPHTLEECADKLMTCSKQEESVDPTQPFPDRLLIEVELLDPDHGRFHLLRDAGCNLYAEVVGTLERNGNSTDVTGRGSVGVFTLGFFALWLTVWAFISPAARVYGLLLFGMGVVGFLYWVTALESKRLIRLTRRILDRA